jgi:hypothetical protein
MNTFKRFQFSEQFGPTFIADWDNPLSIFDHFFDSGILNHIVYQSNKYAAQNGI